MRRTTTGRAMCRVSTLTAAFKPEERFYGTWALETSAYSRLSDWPGGGVVGIRGTPKPSQVVP